ncbi:MAG TPA: hypothetical protein VD793_00235 [Gemmatimonadales bacterium]|nr:hypothetical protein [Gemmatimonadales bacterium]
MRHVWLLAAVGCLLLWIVLAFVVAWRSGWAHLPLAVGVILLVKAMVEADEVRRHPGEQPPGSG